MYTDMYPSLQCWMELFHVPKHPLLVSHFLVQRQPAVGGSVGGRQEISGAFGESLPHASVLAANTKAKDGRAQPGFAVKASNRRKKWLDHKPDGGDLVKTFIPTLQRPTEEAWHLSVSSSHAEPA